MLKLISYFHFLPIFKVHSIQPNGQCSRSSIQFLFKIGWKLKYLLRFTHLYDNMRLCFVHFPADWILKVFFFFWQQKSIDSSCLGNRKLIKISPVESYFHWFSWTKKLLKYKTPPLIHFTRFLVLTSRNSWTQNFPNWNNILIAELY